MKRGLILGGGGVRGVAHIGVLDVIEERSISIDYISGNSAGALIAALYSSGLTPDEINKAVVDAKPYKVFEFPKIKTLTSLLGGHKLTSFLESHLGQTTFEELEIPLVVNALDINTGEIKYIDSGSVVDAVRASISIPGVFTPVERDGAYLVDAGFIDPLPVKCLPPCDEYLCVDVSSVQPKIDENSSFKDTFRRYVYMIQEKNMHRQLENTTNLRMIQPDASSWLMLDMRNYDDLRQKGREAMEKEYNSEI